MPDVTHASQAQSPQAERAGPLEQAQFDRFQRTAKVVCIAAVVAVPFFTVLGILSGAWQIAAEAGLVLVCLACLGVGYRFARRGRFDAAGYLVLFGVIVAYGGAELIWSGAALYSLVGGIALIILLGSILLPHRSLSWLAGAGLYLGYIWLANQIALWPRYEYSQSALLSLFIPLVTLTLVAAAMWQIVHIFRAGTLRAKLVIAFLAVSLLSLAAVAGSAIYLSRLALVDSANRSLFAAASETAAKADNFINATKDALRVEAQLADLSDYLSLPADARTGTPQEERVARILSSFYRKDTINIASYALLDRSGKNVLDTVADDIGRDYADREFFLKPVQDGVPYASAVEFAPESGSHNLLFSAPVRNSAGEIIGVLRARYNPAVLQALAVTSANLLGEGSGPIILDENMLRVADSIAPELLYKTVVPLSPDRAAELQAAQRLPNVPAGELSTNQPDMAAGLNAADTQQYFAAEAQPGNVSPAVSQSIEQVAVTRLTSKPWYVAFAQPQEIFLQPVENQARVIFLLALGIAGLATAAALALAQTLTTPVVHLTTVAGRVAQGDLSAQASVETRDEIGALALAFNSMTAQLRDMVATLEQRVSMRTEQAARQRRCGPRGGVDSGHEPFAARDRQPHYRSVRLLLRRGLPGRQHGPVGSAARGDRRCRPQFKGTQTPAGSWRPIHGGRSDEDAHRAHCAGCRR